MIEFNPNELPRRDADRMKTYRQLLDFYHGVHWEGRPARGEKRLTFNYAKVLVDKVTSYLMSGTTFAVDPVEDSNEARGQAKRAEQALLRVNEDNNLEQLDFDTEIDCAILGDACYKVTWDNELGKVRVTAPDVQGMYAWWLGDDVSRLWRAASPFYSGKGAAAGASTTLTLPQTLQTGGLALQFHQCAPVEDSGHFQSPEAMYSLSLALVNLLKAVAIL